MPFRMALGAWIIKTRPEIKDEKVVKQIQENPDLLIIIGLSGNEDSIPIGSVMDGVPTHKWL